MQAAGTPGRRRAVRPEETDSPRIEREGISYRHPSRFILVGTMNPEEGELRPQLLDRFGLCLEVTGSEEHELRVELMERREAIAAAQDLGYVLAAELSDELDTVGQDEVFHFRNGVVVYLLTIHGVQDDAIRAERYRVSFRQGEDGLRLVQVGRQQQCARGHVRGWTMRSCP